MEPLLPVLESHWRRSFEALGLAVPQGIFQALVERYQEPQRAYHTLQHVSECIGHLTSVRNAPQEVALAVWFHDAIYNPRASDNEKRSAAWARAVLGDTPVGGKVETMVLATKHEAVPQDAAARLLVDIDLAILAAPEPRYSEYETQIRKEYAFVDDATWRIQRQKVLRSFSDRAFIYGSAEFRALETRARRNLERSINALIVGKR
jgi:predicted metal-dependent HD superfamily phosphohydrolase